MGRKNRIQKHSRRNAPEPEVEEVEPDSAVEVEIKLHLLRVQTAQNIQRELIEYCDRTSVPLCEYLTVEMLTEYLQHLMEWFNTFSGMKLRV